MAWTSKPGRKHTILFICCALTFPARAQTDTVQHELRGVEVMALRNRSALHSDAGGALHVSLSLMDELPKILGNADPLHYAQMLPSVSINSELDAGFRVQGCATGQSQIAIGHAPVYNPAHALGFFSTFIPSHFADFSLRTTADASTPNLLGGVLAMNGAQQPADSLSGTLAVGIISSQGTVRLPLRGRQSLTLSARQSYINLLYGSFVRFDDMAFHYRFGDYNTTYSARWGRHRLSVNGYFGQDRAGMTDDVLGMDLRFRWQNGLVDAELSSILPDGSQLDQALYATHNSNLLGVSFVGVDGRLPAGLSTCAYRLAHQRPLDTRGRYRLQYGLHLLQHSVQPQNPEAEGGYAVPNEPAARQHATEANAFLLCDWHPAGGWSVRPGLKLTAYRLWTGDAVTALHADPSLHVDYRAPRVGQFAIVLSRNHQYLHQTGFSSVGLPTEFRFAAGSDALPEEAWGATLTYSRHLWQSRYKLVVEVYGKRMLRQVEYHGDILQFITSGYALRDAILHGDGYNYGFNLQLVKQTGRFTGWLSYAFNRSVRRFTGFPGSRGFYPSNYERPHEVNAVGTCRFGRGWSVGATLAFASGTPFTPVERIYYLHDRLISEYGEHNSARLHPYFRLDLSVNYRFRPRRHTRSGLNLSVYNVTAQYNDIYYRVKVFSDGTYAYRNAHIFLRVLPSISYFLEF